MGEDALAIMKRYSPWKVKRRVRGGVVNCIGRIGVGLILPGSSSKGKKGRAGGKSAVKKGETWLLRVSSQ